MTFGAQEVAAKASALAHSGQSHSLTNVTNGVGKCIWLFYLGAGEKD
jgi:hypothetical protein